MDTASKVRFCVLLLAALAFLFLAERRWGVLSKFLREKSTALNLAVIRIVTLVLLLRTVDLRQELVFSTLDSALLFPPLGWGRIAPLVPRSPELVKIFYAVLLVSAVCGIIGLFSRLSCGLACISAFYLLTLPQLFGKVNHSHHLLAFCFLLSLAPSGDTLSVDEIWKAMRNNAALPEHRPPSRIYAACLQTMMLVIACVYFFPGAWKLSHVWLNWFSSSSMYMLIATKLQENAGGNALQRAVLGMPLLLQLGACFTIVFEIGFGFAVLIKRWRLLAAASGLAFHNLTAILMGISFSALQWSYVIFVDWTSLLNSLLNAFHLPPIEVVFDSDSKASRIWINLLVSWDWASRLRPSAALPGATVPRSVFQVVADGQVFEGADAFKRVASRLPMLWLVLPVLALRPFERFVSRLMTGSGSPNPGSVLRAEPGLSSGTGPSIPAHLQYICEIVLVALFCLAGALHSVDSWPIACFPTFDSKPGTVIQKLSARSIMDNRAVEDATLSDDASMGLLLGPERWEGLLNRFAAAPFRQKTGTALFHLWERNHPEGAVQSVTFYRDRYDVDVVTGRQRLIERHALGVISPQDPT